MSKLTMPEPAAWAATSEEGEVEALGFNQSQSRFVTPLYTDAQLEAYVTARVREALEAAADLARAKYEEAMKRREGFDKDEDAAWIIDVLSQALTYSHMEHGIRQMIPQQ